MAASDNAGGRLPCGRRRRQGVQPRAIFGEVEVAALVFFVQRHLPSMLAAGGRPGSGYTLRDRRQRWARVRRLVRAESGVRRTFVQLTHRWADILDREQDLLDLLGVEVPGLAPKGRRGGAVVDGGAGAAEAQPIGASDDSASAQPNTIEAGPSTAAGGGATGGIEAAATGPAAPARTRPSRQEIAARLRQQRLERVRDEYRRLVDREAQQAQAPVPATVAPPQPARSSRAGQLPRRRIRAAATTRTRFTNRLHRQLLQRMTSLERTVEALRVHIHSAIP